MKPILVHVHVFYPALWQELKQSVLNIAPNPFDLFVTLVAPLHEIEADVRATFPDAVILHVPNRGYDVGPFIEVLNKADLSQYSYIVKLHTKRDMPQSTSTFRGLAGEKWRQTALSFLKSPEIFNAYLIAFENNASLGMQADVRLIAREKGHRFVAGTMFFARASLFKPLQDIHYDFAETSAHTEQAAHALERRFGALMEEQGFYVRDAVNDPTESELKMYFFYDCFIAPVIRFFYQRKVTKSGKVIIKVCKVPVCVLPVHTPLT